MKSSSIIISAVAVAVLAANYPILLKTSPDDEVFTTTLDSSYSVAEITEDCNIKQTDTECDTVTILETTHKTISKNYTGTTKTITSKPVTRTPQKKTTTRTTTKKATQTAVKTSTNNVKTTPPTTKNTTRVITTKSTTKATTKATTTTIVAENYYGRLYIPSAQISIALYSDDSQETVDRSDSAAIFNFYPYRGKVIADHSYQGFSNLVKVEVGTTGYIVLKDGRTVNIKCVDAFNGYNTSDMLTDQNRKEISGDNDYIMYTCKSGYQAVRICLWDII